MLPRRSACGALRFDAASAAAANQFRGRLLSGEQALRFFDPHRCTPRRPTTQCPRHGSCRRHSATPEPPPRRWRSRRPCARPSGTNRRVRSPGTGNSAAKRYLAFADRGREAVDEELVDRHACACRPCRERRPWRARRAPPPSSRPTDRCGTGCRRAFPSGARPDRRRRATRRESGSSAARRSTARARSSMSRAIAPMASAPSLDPRCNRDR